nr:atherin-like [Microcebus murinus]
MARSQRAAPPQTQAPALAALPRLRLCSLSWARPCAAGELGAAGAQRPAPSPAALHLARVARPPPPPPRLLRPRARPIPVAPPPPQPAPAAGRLSIQRESILTGGPTGLHVHLHAGPELCGRCAHRQLPRGWSLSERDSGLCNSQVPDLNNLDFPESGTAPGGDRGCRSPQR